MNIQIAKIQFVELLRNSYGITIILMSVLTIVFKHYTANVCNREMPPYGGNTCVFFLFLYCLAFHIIFRTFATPLVVYSRLFLSFDAVRIVPSSSENNDFNL